MDERAKLQAELEPTPDPLIGEVIDFVRFLKLEKGSGEGRVTALASEQVLARDWLRPEEDEAWRSL